MNNTTLTGRLTKDVELRRTPQGTAVTQFTIAVRRERRVEGQPEADFIQCVAWNKTAELMAQYLHKGSLIGLEGRIQTRSYENQQGQRVYVTEVITDRVEFLDSRGQQAQPQAQPQPQPQANAYGGYDPMYNIGGGQDIFGGYEPYDPNR